MTLPHHFAPFRLRRLRVLPALVAGCVGACAHSPKPAPNADVEPPEGPTTLGEPADSPDPETLPATAEQRATGESRLTPALARVLAASGVRLDQLADVQVVAAALGGAPSGDQVVAAELFADTRHLASALWIVGGQGDARRVLASEHWPASDAEDGYYDTPAGIRELAIARSVWPDRDVLRVSLVRRQGGHDPRYLTDTVFVLALEGDRIETLFACARSEEVVSGPARAGVAIARQIDFSGGLPEDIRVSRQSTYDPGVLDEHEAERDRRERGLAADDLPPVSARYRFSQGRYRPLDLDVCQPN